MSWRSREGWADAEQVEPDELRVSPLALDRFHDSLLFGGFSSLKTLLPADQIMGETFHYHRYFYALPTVRNTNRSTTLKILHWYGK